MNSIKSKLLKLLFHFLDFPSLFLYLSNDFLFSVSVHLLQLGLEDQFLLIYFWYLLQVVEVAPIQLLFVNFSGHCVAALVLLWRSAMSAFCNFRERWNPIICNFQKGRDFKAAADFSLDGDMLVNASLNRQLTALVKQTKLRAICATPYQVSSTDRELDSRPNMGMGVWIRLLVRVVIRCNGPSWQMDVHLRSFILFVRLWFHFFPESDSLYSSFPLFLDGCSFSLRRELVGKEKLFLLSQMFALNLDLLSKFSEVELFLFLLFPCMLTPKPWWKVFIVQILGPKTFALVNQV